MKQTDSINDIFKKDPDTHDFPAARDYQELLFKPVDADQPV